MDRQLLGGERQKVQTARAELELPEGRVLVLRPVRVKDLGRFEEVWETIQAEPGFKVGPLFVDLLELAQGAMIDGKPAKRADYEEMDLQTLGQCAAALVGVMQWVPFGGADAEESAPIPKATRSKKA